MRRILHNAGDVSRSIISRWLSPLTSLLSTAEYERKSHHCVCMATILAGGSSSSSSIDDDGSARIWKHVCSLDLQPLLRSCDTSHCCNEWLDTLKLYARSVRNHLIS